MIPVVLPTLGEATMALTDVPPLRPAPASGRGIPPLPLSEDLCLARSARKEGTVITLPCAPRRARPGPGDVR
jgi:hypothetical protein